MSMAPSSPRLPSPPPAAEIQIGPNSPSGGPAATLQATEMEQSILDANSKRRVHPGTKAADMAAGPPLVPLNELDSAFQLQEHLAALHYHHTASGTQALTRETALQLAQPPLGIDRTLWLYELCRFLISQCNSLIVGFLFDTPPCSASTCPEMRASEWQFLCAVHEQPKSCCAIDYCCHTLDWAANVVSDQKIFPSRFVVLNDAHSKNVGVKSLVNVFRRLHRIFAHAWFQHRSVFWSVEGQSGLYVFFKTVCDLYDLLPAENYKLPPEAEGLEAPPSEPQADKPMPTILKPPTQQHGNGGADEENFHQVGRTNTRRHIRSSPSTGSAVTTVLEAEEEDADGVSRRLKAMQLSAPGMEGEPEDAEVPVMVDQSVVTDSSQPSAPAETDEGLDGTATVPNVDPTVREVPPEPGLPTDVPATSDEPIVSTTEIPPPDTSEATAEPKEGAETEPIPAETETEGKAAEDAPTDEPSSAEAASKEALTTDTKPADQEADAKAEPVKDEAKVTKSESKE